MKDKEFLNWLADRLVNIYLESELTDFVRKLRSIATTIPDDQDTDMFVADRSIQS